ncbi:DUF3307 domain-containing protein [Streptomyces sp. NPDC003300]|uniref:DUF3307 domain-containing protein n=1 Tax=unclassified Streptomyces TaxID=2593676 RepID=UPI0033AB77B5
MFATVFVLLFVAHMVADYAVQTDHQATHKADRTAEGWRANLTHAGTHVVACALALAAGAALLDGVHLPVARAVAAVAWVGVSHGFIDRRWPIAWWMDNTGSADFRTRGGAQHVDQTAHLLCLAVAALIVAA